MKPTAGSWWRFIWHLFPHGPRLRPNCCCPSMPHSHFHHGTIDGSINVFNDWCVGHLPRTGWRQMIGLLWKRGQSSTNSSFLPKSAIRAESPVSSGKLQQGFPPTWSLWVAMNSYERRGPHGVPPTVLSMLYCDFISFSHVSETEDVETCRLAARGSWRGFVDLILFPLLDASRRASEGHRHFY